MAVLVTTCHQKLGAGGGASPSVRQSAGPVQAPDKSALMSDSTGWLLANAAVVPQAPVVTLHQMEEGRTSRAPWKFFRPQCRCASGLRKDGCCGCCLSSDITAVGCGNAGWGQGNGMHQSQRLHVALLWLQLDPTEGEMRLLNMLTLE